MLDLMNLKHLEYVSRLRQLNQNSTIIHMIGKLIASHQMHFTHSDLHTPNPKHHVQTER